MSEPAPEGPSATRRCPAAAVAAFLAGLLAGTFAAAAPSVVRAEQRRDYMLELQPAGTFGILDYFTTGGRLTLEHRERIYGSANDVTVAAEGLFGYPLGELAARLDVRVLFLSFGGTVGYRTVWRNLSFEPGADGEYCADCDRGSRRDRDKIFGASPGSDDWPWIEGRSALLLPFNDYVVMASLGALRYEGTEARTFDWFFMNVHDGGLIARWETQLYLKHRDWGGIGPYVQLMALPRAGEHEAQWAAGFNATTRLGLLARNDLLFLTFLIRPGDPRYGAHSYYAPIRTLLIYRMIFPL